MGRPVGSPVRNLEPWLGSLRKSRWGDPLGRPFEIEECGVGLDSLGGDPLGRPFGIWSRGWDL